MARVIVTEHAKWDVREIISDLNRRAGHIVASRYATDFKDVYRNLAQFAESGPLRPALGPLPASSSSTPTSSSTTAMP
jgi:plasmid stabilization system protein ParE